MTDAELLAWIELRLRKLFLKKGIYTLRFFDARGEQYRVKGTSLRNCVENAVAGTNVEQDYDTHD